MKKRANRAVARDSGPRPEARNQANCKKKVTKVTAEFTGAVGKRTLWKKTKEASASHCNE